MQLKFDWKALPFVLLAVLLIVWPALCQELRDGRILRDGTPAKARVVAIKPTGSSYNDDQEMRLELEVQPEGREPYRARVEAYLHPVHFPRYQPGAEVDVRFDPEKPSHVALVSP
jgi:hypothetical protein